MKLFAALLFLVLSPVVLAGEWTLSDGVLESGDGKWAFSGSSISGTTLTIGSCTKYPDDGILDFRSAVVNGKNIALLKIVNNTTYSTQVVDFYCDKLDKLVQSLFSGNEKLKRFHVSSMNQRNIYANTFKNCTSLTNAYFGGPITGVAIDCFNGCSQLEARVEDFISSSIGGLATRAFKGCKKLTGKLHFKNIGSFSSSGSCFEGTGIEELVIDSENDSFQSFSTAPFANCLALTNVTIRSTKFVKIPGNAIFSGCNQIKQVTLDIPNVNLIDGGTGPSRMFYGCSGISELRMVGKPWRDANGNDLVKTALENHILYSVSAVGAAVDGPKKCSIYAIRKDYSSLASAFASDNEKAHAPNRCYGVFVTSAAGRKAYMAEPPDYWPGLYLRVH